MGTQLPLPQRGTAPPPIFGPYLLQPNGCMDQDVTWYGARPRPRRLCVKWEPRSPSTKRGGGRSPKLSSHVYCGQTAGWMKVVLGKGVGLSPGDFVLDGHPALPPNKGGEAPSQLSAHFDCAQTSHDDGRKSLRRRRRSAGGRSDLSTTSQRPQNAAQRHVLSSAARRSAFRAVSRVLVTTSG